MKTSVIFTFLLYALLTASLVVIIIYSYSIQPPRVMLSCLYLVDSTEATSGFLSQYNQALISYIQQNILEPPSNLPYNITNPHNNNIINYIFKQKVNGTFFEAGVLDGETKSDTLYLEKYRCWRGLLTEGYSKNQKRFRSKHRKAWFVPSLVCKNNYTNKAPFYDPGLNRWLRSLRGEYKGNIFRCSGYKSLVYILEEDRDVREEIEYSNCDLVKIKDLYVQCFPFYSLVTAVGFTVIDYVSLKEEFQVIDTLPLDRILIKVLHIKVPDSVVSDLENKMNSKGYTRLKLLENKVVSGQTNDKSDTGNIELPVQQLKNLPTEHQTKNENYEKLEDFKWTSLHSKVPKDVIFIKNGFTIPIT